MRRVLHPGHRQRAIAKPFHQLDATHRVDRRAARGHFGDKDMLGLEPKVERAHVVEATYEQSGTDKQHYGDRAL